MVVGELRETLNRAIGLGAKEGTCLPRFLKGLIELRVARLTCGIGSLAGRWLEARLDAGLTVLYLRLILATERDPDRSANHQERYQVTTYPAPRRRSCHNAPVRHFSSDSGLEGPPEFSCEKVVGEGRMPSPTKADSRSRT